ncbi:hypothetical protein LINPERHAP2_LOCUS17307 [Linum perenne]
MCTSISSDGDGGVGGGGESHQSVCMFSKKTKKQRVPKRGPGVAELEKILRREDHVPSSATVAAAVNLLPPPSPPATAATTTLFSIPSQHYSFSPQPMTWNPTESSRSSFQFPFSTLLGSNNGGLDHHQKQKQKQRNQQYSHFPTMMNFFPSSSSSSAGDGEPPSNQRFSRQFPDKQTMTGGKRHCPFAIDAVPEAPPFRFQVPSYLPQVEVVNTDSRLTISAFHDFIFFVQFLKTLYSAYDVCPHFSQREFGAIGLSNKYPHLKRTTHVLQSSIAAKIGGKL